MKKQRWILTAALLAAALTAVTVIACGGGSNPADSYAAPRTVTYTGTAGGAYWTLVITENTAPAGAVALAAGYGPKAGDRYALTRYGSTIKRSRGRIKERSADGKELTLTKTDTNTDFITEVSTDGTEAITKLPDDVPIDTAYGGGTQTGGTATAIAPAQVSGTLTGTAKTSAGGPTYSGPALTFTHFDAYADIRTPLASAGLGNATVSGSGAFSFTLAAAPTVAPAVNLTGTFVSYGFAVSDTSAKILGIQSFYNAGDGSDTKQLIRENTSFDTTFYFYTDKDVTVRGVISIDATVAAIDLNLKTGWNTVVATNGGSTLLSGAPVGDWVVNSYP
ncbi:MAG: hypothetical protein LBD31_06415 [Treponema sp.]|jgi:hypothetical protein|nr:hypothetical protein [Treponema sp.]